MDAEQTIDKEWYEEWFNTSYYHLLYRNRDHQEAADFIDRLIDYLKPLPGSKMLDLACGSGRHAIQLAEKGFEVTGLDLSANSIANAKTFEKENLTFYTHDMRLPFRTNYFDYIFNFFTSFGYFESWRDHQKTIQSMSIGLSENGILVIDYLNPVYTEKRLIPESKDEAENVAFVIHRNANQHHFFKQIEVRDKILNKTFFFSERVSKISLSEFEQLFSKAGLKIMEIFGDYTLQPFDVEHSKRMIMIVGKIK